MKKRIIVGLLVVLFLSSILFIKLNFLPRAQAVTAACATNAAAQNNITVIPSHGQAFYVDTGYSPKLDAGYVGYRVVNGSSTALSNLWVQVNNFTGGNISLANPDDSMMQLSSIANRATSTAYFLLKAIGATNTAQTHTVSIYNGRPDVSGSALLYTCVYTFSQVKETISANSNSVSSVTSSTNSPVLGQNVVITVVGATGNIGSGSSPDSDLIWLTPAAVSSWPTAALRLQSVTASFTKNPTTYNYTDQLMISGANSICTGNGCNYTATYTFRVIGRPNSTVQAVPSAAIASGTQTKHTSISPVNLSFSSFTVNASLTKTVTSTSGLSTTTISGIQYVGVPYQMRATTTNSTNLTIDEFVDTPGNGIIFKSGSASVTDVGRSNVVIPDPVQLSSESGQSPQPYHFVGPFNVSSTTPATLNYTMWVPVGTYSNIAYAKINDLIIGANSSAMSQINVTSSGGTSVTSSSTTTSIPVVAITQPATSASSTSVTLNGTVNPYGASPLTAVFLYSTNSNLSGAVTATATSPSSGDLSGISVPTNVSVNITGLSVNTTYYYKVVASSTSGEILSFTTLAVQASPTVSVQAATNLNLTNATLNGTINPNLTSVTAIQFLYSTSSTISVATTTLTLDDGAGAALTAGGSSAQTFSTTTLSNLIGGSTYYYKIRACTASSGTYPNITCSAFADSSITSFLASGAPTVQTNAASFVGSSVATLNGTIKANYSTTTVSFIYSTVSDLSSGTTTVSAGTVTGSASTTVSSSISGLSPSTTYYFRAIGTNSNTANNGSILSFTTSAVNRTITIDSSSYVSAYTYASSTPTLTSTASAGGGTKTYSSYTTSVCTVNSSSGVVTFVGTGTCTLGVSISASTPYTDASSPTISFTINTASRTLTINNSSYVSSYSFASTTPTLTATSTAGTGTISFTSSTTGVCTVDSSSGLVTFVSLGTCTIYSDITSDGLYSSATSPSISFTIIAASRTLTIDNGSYSPSYNLTDSPPTLTATPSAGTGTITFTSNTTGVCTVNSTSGLVAFVSQGSCDISASISASGGYGSANSPHITFTIINADRTLTIDSSSYSSSYIFTDAPPTLTVTTSAGTGILTFDSHTTSVCTVNATTGAVTFVGSGTCTIHADIGPDGTYTEAISPFINFTVNVAPRTLNIGGYNPNYLFTDGPPTITATPTAGVGTESFTSTSGGICGINSLSGLVNFVSTGICSIYAIINSDSQYASATSSTASFNINAVSRTLTIDSSSYASSSAYTLDQTPPTLTSTPSAGSGGISFTGTTPSVCTVDSSSGTVTFVSAGTCTVNSTIASNGGYTSATSSDVSFTLSLAPRTLTIDSSSYRSSYDISDATPTLTSTPSAGSGTITYSSNTSGVCTIDASTGAVTFVSSGTCTLGASIAANGIYASVNASSISFSVTSTPTPTPTPVSSGGGGGTVYINGCTDLKAVNYNSRANYNNGSCIYSTSTKVPAQNPNLQTQNNNQFTNKLSSDSSAQNQGEPKTICTPYLTSYIKLGDKNNPAEVKKLQQFLNEYEGELLAVDGNYKSVDVEAIKRFQAKYKDILAAWNLKNPTGWVYTATQNMINRLHCQQATALSCPYFTQYQKEKDISPEVEKIKRFLNNYQNAGLTISPVYDSQLIQAVKNFQATFLSETLSPWGLVKPTGQWYQSTRKKANDLLGCYQSVKLDNGKLLP